jgi:hypothetical protein
MDFALPQDVVTANPDSWSFDPFKLTREGDKLLGRGVTDCLGHVALLTELFRQLAVTQPPLKATVMGVFIANEENSTVSWLFRSLGFPTHINMPKVLCGQVFETI